MIVRGDKLKVGLGVSTVLADMDFETYSEAGYYFDAEARKWKSITASPPHGIGAVGASAYTEHPSAEVLSLAYDLKDGHGARLWLPGMPPPLDLFEHIAGGHAIEAHNSMFEFYVWSNVCVRMGWPELPLDQLRDSMAKSSAWAMPQALGKLGDALRLDTKKDKDGTRLLNKFSKPRNPTKTDDRLRLLPMHDAVDGAKLYDYNVRDIETEAAASAKMPDLSPDELTLWKLDQQINARGCYIDREGLENCRAVVDAAIASGCAELESITGGAVRSPGEIAKIRAWLAGAGVHVSSLDAEHVEKALERDDLPTDARRVLQLRASLGAASVKKLYAMGRRLSADGRLRDMFSYHGAATGRWAGRGPQPQNLPNSGPLDDWGIEHVEAALALMRTRDVNTLSAMYGDAVGAVSGCLRGLFCAAPGHDLICSDYSAIEAVVLAALAGEQWRLDVFHGHGKIYEMSAATITGTPFEEFERHKRETGDHHPLRKKVGKVAELASGYQGGVGAWKAFGADKFMTDEEIKANVKAWRAASPAIVDFWYGLERAAIAAVKAPGTCFDYRGISFGMKGDALYCRLLSGRFLTYHEPRLIKDETPWGKIVDKLTFMGVDSFTKKWTRIDTYGGKLCENVVQATARDILAHAMVELDKAGYKTVLHIHDEVVAEVLKGFGSVDEFERIMAELPPWCAGWPIRAAGGWRGARYRKD